MGSSNKSVFRKYLDAFRHPDNAAFEKAATAFFAEEAAINIVHPFNEINGAAGFIDHFLGSLHGSFDNLYRRDYIAMGGVYENGDWVTSTGYYVGHFARDWLGIKASDRLTYLRVGEFHRMEEGRAVESYIYLDIPELMIGVGQWPIRSTPALKHGHTGFLPGPATQDGLQWHDNDSDLSSSSFQIVSDMLLGLATEDEQWRPYWHENMMWYGPAAFGSFVGIENFASFQVPFEQT